eukprot:3934482-Rhodomonas_salina.2
MFYAYRTRQSLEAGRDILLLLTEMLKSGLYAQAASFILGSGRTLNFDSLNALWKARIAPAELTDIDVFNIFCPD